MTKLRKEIEDYYLNTPTFLGSNKRPLDFTIKTKNKMIYFSKYNWTKDCYKPSFQRFYNGKMWSFSIYKYGVTFDFR
jgi:hypothetical protein